MNAVTQSKSDPLVSMVGEEVIVTFLGSKNPESIGVLEQTSSGFQVANQEFSADWLTEILVDDDGTTGLYLAF